MVVMAEDEEGKEIVLIDPAGVYLEEAVDQADFRILGQLRMQKFGLTLYKMETGMVKVTSSIRREWLRFYWEKNRGSLP